MPGRARIKADLSVVLVAALVTLLSLISGIVLWTVLAAIAGSFAIAGFGAAEVTVSLTLAALILRTRVVRLWPVFGVLIGFVLAPVVFLLYLAIVGANPISGG